MKNGGPLKDGNDVQEPDWKFDPSMHFKPKIDSGEYYLSEGAEFMELISETLIYHDPKLSEEKRQKQFCDSQKALYFWSIFEGQVGNGGLIQYFYNGYGNQASSVVKGLALIGSSKVAELVTNAYQIYLENKDEFDDAEKAGLFESDLYERFESLNKLDNLFLDLRDDVNANFESFIRRHVSDFCHNENGEEINPTYTGTIETQHKNGKTKYRLEVKNGLLNGKVLTFSNKGSLKKEAIYSDSRATVEVRKYYEDGSQKELYHTIGNSDDKVGTFTKWHENGQIKESGECDENGDNIGFWVRYYDNGQKELERRFDDLSPIFINYWLENGEQTLTNGTGTIKNLFEGCVYERSYRNHKLHGIWSVYRESGIIHYSNEYRDDEQHGKALMYYENGNLRKEGLYENGKKVSERVFPKYKNSKIQVNITCEMEDEWLMNRELQPADTYPVPSNLDQVALRINMDISSFDKCEYSHDKIQSCRHWVTIDASGNVAEADLLISDMGIDMDQVQKGFLTIRFTPAMKNGKAVKSYLSLRHEFLVVDADL